jgi:hypothetical protein
VVVHDIDDDGDAAFVGFPDEGAKAIRSAILFLDGEDVGGIVSP